MKREMETLKKEQRSKRKQRNKPNTKQLENNVNEKKNKIFHSLFVSR